jgi:hypothetical protein
MWTAATTGTSGTPRAGDPGLDGLRQSATPTAPPWSRVPAGPDTEVAVESGFLRRAETVQALVERRGIDPAGLRRTVHLFNGVASTGRDQDCGRSDSAYDRCYGDPCVRPNPTWADRQAALYAVQAPFQPADRAQPCLEPAVIGFDPVAGVLLGQVQGARDELVEDPQVRSRLVGGHLDRRRPMGQGPGEETAGPPQHPAARPPARP